LGYKYECGGFVKRFFVGLKPSQSLKTLAGYYVCASETVVETTALASENPDGLEGFGAWLRWLKPPP